MGEDKQGDLLMRFIFIILCIVLSLSVAQAEGQFHQIQALCNDGKKPLKGDSGRLMLLSSPSTGELTYFDGSDDGYYGCDIQLQITLSEQFVPPHGDYSCIDGPFVGWVLVNMDLPVMQKTEEKTLSLNPLRKNFKYEASAQASSGYCAPGIKLILNIFPLK